MSKPLYLAAFIFIFLTTGCVGLDGTVIVPMPAVDQSATTQTAALVFSSPEEAITHYLNGIIQNDPAVILQASAVTEMGEGFNFEHSVERFGGLLPLASSASLLPAAHSYYAELNKAHLASQLLGQARNFSLGLLIGDNVNAPFMAKPTQEQLARIVSDLNPQRLSTITPKMIRLPNEQIMSTPRYLENAASAAITFGADESTERVVLFSFEDADYYTGFQLLRYGDGWKINRQSSPLGNTEPSGVPTSTTEAEFLALTGQE